MAKLHEVLAVESGLQTTAKKVNEETIRTFGKKDEHFVETTRRVEFFDEADREKLNTTEHKAMVTTVLDKLLLHGYPEHPCDRRLPSAWRDQSEGGCRYRDQRCAVGEGCANHGAVGLGDKAGGTAAYL